MATFTISPNTGGECLNNPISVTVTDTAGKNFGRNNQDKSYTIKTYTDNTYTTPMGPSNNFTVRHKTADYLILDAAVKTSGDAPTTAEWQALVGSTSVDTGKSIPSSTSSPSTPLGSLSGTQYCIYGRTNGRSLSFPTGSNLQSNISTVGTLKYTTTLPNGQGGAVSWNNGSSNSTYRYVPTQIGDSDVYYFYIVITVVSGASSKLTVTASENQQSAGTRISNTYTITTTASGEVSFSTNSITIPIQGGDLNTEQTALKVSNTTSADVYVAKNTSVSGYADNFFTMTGATVAHQTPAAYSNFYLTGTTPNVSTSTVSGQEFISALTSSDKKCYVGYKASQAASWDNTVANDKGKACLVTQSGGSLDMDNSILALTNTGQHATMLPGGTLRLELDEYSQYSFGLNSIGFVNGVTTGKRVWINCNITSNPLSTDLSDNERILDASRTTTDNISQLVNIYTNGPSRNGQPAVMNLTWAGPNGTPWTGDLKTLTVQVSVLSSGGNATVSIQSGNFTIEASKIVYEVILTFTNWTAAAESDFTANINSYKLGVPRSAGASADFDNYDSATHTMRFTSYGSWNNSSMNVYLDPPVSVSDYNVDSTGKSITLVQ